MTGPAMHTATSHVPDGEFWARFFPIPAPGEVTIYVDTCPADPVNHRPGPAARCLAAIVAG